MVTCRETGRPTLIEIDTLRASLTSTAGCPDIQVENCTRWPMKSQCGQECLTTLDLGRRDGTVGGWIGTDPHFGEGRKELSDLQLHQNGDKT